MLAVSLLLLLLAGHLVLRSRRSSARRRGTVRRLSESLAVSRALTRLRSAPMAPTLVCSRSMPFTGRALAVSLDDCSTPRLTFASPSRSGPTKVGNHGAASPEVLEASRE